jgi:hypothetical protein
VNVQLQARRDTSPLFGTAVERASAIHACIAASRWRDDQWYLIVGLRPALVELLGSYNFQWLDEGNLALARLHSEVERAQSKWWAGYLGDRRKLPSTPHTRREVVCDAAAFTVDFVARRLAPAIHAPRFVDVAILLGPDLVELRDMPRRASFDELMATWRDGSSTSARTRLTIDDPDLVTQLRRPEHNSSAEVTVCRTSTVDLRCCHRKWTPTVDVLEPHDGRTWDIDALRYGETVAWHDLSDRQLFEIVNYLSSYRRCVEGVATWGSNQFDYALTEARVRGLLPTTDTLYAAIDHALAHGHIVDAHDIARLSLVDVWTRLVPLLDARG